ncbi:hypothetical protein [Petroclostridium xylanilyticum]|uniref:hypothetical protein n=1 Tax=Petroclostridium xylanilyticum TaxID=1792311 RepID=UPI0018E35DD0|nr:hypothetical protein [Petroclostridium xylanilyticum]
MNRKAVITLHCISQKVKTEEFLINSKKKIRHDNTCRTNLHVLICEAGAAV